MFCKCTIYEFSHAVTVFLIQMIALKSDLVYEKVQPDEEKHFGASKLIIYPEFDSSKFSRLFRTSNAFPFVSLFFNTDLFYHLDDEVRYMNKQKQLKTIYYYLFITLNIYEKHMNMKMGKA